MATTVSLSTAAEETARMEIRDFLKAGLEDIRNNSIYDMEKVFDELDGRYKDERV